MKKLLLAVCLITANAIFGFAKSNANLFVQSFFPYNGISFSYTVENIKTTDNTDLPIQKGGVVFSTVSKAYKSVELNKNNSGNCFSYSNGTLASGVIEKGKTTFFAITKDNGITNFPAVLAAFIDPYNLFSPILNKQNFKEFTVEESENQIKLSNITYNIFFDKTSFLPKQIETKFSAKNGVFIGQKAVFESFENVGGVKFPTRIHITHRDENGKLFLNCTYKLGNISFNNITQNQLKIDITEGTIANDIIDDILRANNLPNCIEFSYTKTEANDEKQTLKSANRIAYNFVANEYNYETKPVNGQDLAYTKLNASFLDHSYKVLRTLKDGNNAAIFSKSPIIFKVPDIIGAWTSPYNGNSYFEILKNADKASVKILNQKDTISIKFEKLYELKIDKKSLLVCEIILYNENADNSATIYQKIKYESHKNFEKYRIPLKISYAFYNQKQEPFSFAEFFINEKSVKTNVNVCDILHLPAGTTVIDKESGQSYVVNEINNPFSIEEKVNTKLQNKQQ